MEKELIRMNGSRSEIFTTCFQAMEIYKQLYNTTFVPRNYVVPQNATSYPEALWGCRLGGFYDGIYHNGNYMNVHYFDKLVELDVIGVYFVSLFSILCFAYAYCSWLCLLCFE